MGGIETPQMVGAPRHISQFLHRELQAVAVDGTAQILHPLVSGSELLHFTYPFEILQEGIILKKWKGNGDIMKTLYMCVYILYIYTCVCGGV
jgi:hypothetical protein